MLDTLYQITLRPPNAKLSLVSARCVVVGRRGIPGRDEIYPEDPFDLMCLEIVSWGVSLSTNPAYSILLRALMAPNAPIAKTAL